jgi:hypothetical protein
MLIAGFVMGRLTAPTPTPDTKEVAARAPSASGALPPLSAAAAAPAAPAATTVAPIALATETAPTVPQSPEPAGKAPEAARVTPEQAVPTQSKATRQVAGTGRLAPALRSEVESHVANPPRNAQPVDPFVQAVKQSINEDEANQKRP